MQARFGKSRQGEFALPARLVTRDYENALPP